MNIQFLLGVLVSDGSLTGDSKQPSIQIKMRDHSIDLLSKLQQNFGGKLYGPYSPGKSSMAKGMTYQLMWRGKDLKKLLQSLDQIPIDEFDSNFNQKYSIWKRKYQI